MDRMERWHIQHRTPGRRRRRRLRRRGRRAAHATAPAWSSCRPGPASASTTSSPPIGAPTTPNAPPGRARRLDHRRRRRGAAPQDALPVPPRPSHRRCRGRDRSTSSATAGPARESPTSDRSSCGPPPRRAAADGRRAVPARRGPGRRRHRLERRDAPHAARPLSGRPARRRSRRSARAAPNARVVLAGIPRSAGCSAPSSPLIFIADQYARLLRPVAASRGRHEPGPPTRTCRRACPDDRGREDVLSSDQFHPSVVGYDAWADVMFEALTRRSRSRCRPRRWSLPEPDAGIAACEGRPNDAMLRAEDSVCPPSALGGDPCVRSWSWSSLATLLASLGFAAPAAGREAALKVAIIVGPVGEELTPVYISLADAAAAAAETRGATVARAYSPEATAENGAGRGRGRQHRDLPRPRGRHPEPVQRRAERRDHERLGPERARSDRHPRGLLRRRLAGLLRRGMDRRARQAGAGLGHDLLQRLLCAGCVRGLRRTGRRGDRRRARVAPTAARRWPSWAHRPTSRPTSTPAPRTSSASFSTSPTCRTATCSHPSRTSWPMAWRACRTPTGGRRRDVAPSLGLLRRQGGLLVRLRGRPDRDPRRRQQRG